MTATTATRGSPGVRRIVSIILGTWIIVTIGTLGNVHRALGRRRCAYMTVITLDHGGTAKCDRL
ncbi:MAG: hypothetical protein R3E12_14675 [Candidatus Eisenbacteria bacterium]